MAAPDAPSSDAPASEAASAEASATSGDAGEPIATEAAPAGAGAHGGAAPSSDAAAMSIPPDEPEGPPPEPPKLGEIFRGRIGAVAESGHVALVNHVVDVAAARQAIEASRTLRKRVKGLVYGFNRGGFDVLVRGLRAFCPASGMALGPIDDPDDYIGRKLEFSLPLQKQGSHGIIVSRRSILEKEQRKAARELLKTLGPGQRLKGRVTQVRDFGVFVDVGGVEGLVHMSELSFDRNLRPSDVAKPGDEVEVQVLRQPEIGGRGKDRHDRLSLSIKALEPDPWDQHDEILAEGTVQKGKVMRVAEFGAFVELTPGVEGLLHVSELGRDVKHAAHVLKPGDELDVVIDRVDKKARRVSLSRLSPQEARAFAEGTLTEPGQKPKLLRPGSIAKVVVERVEHHGLHVHVEGTLGKRGRGYIPNSEMATDRGTDHRKLFPVGTKIDVKVIAIERDGGLKCSRKAYLNDEEKRAVSDYRREAAKQGLGTFGDLLRAKLGNAGSDANKG